MQAKIKGDEKQLIDLEWPKGYLHWGGGNGWTLHQLRGLSTVVQYNVQSMVNSTHP